LKYTRHKYMRLAPLACIVALCSGAAGATTLARAAKPAAKAPGATSATTTSSAGSHLDPCTLLTVSQAEAITGRTIATPVEAPQGPTCIYKLTGSKSWITLSIETRKDFAKLRGLMRNGQTVNEGSDSGACGQLGSDNLFLSLTGGRVLHVTASCAIAKQIAAAAVRRLGG
jgi:hypothetical protein